MVSIKTYSPIPGIVPPLHSLLDPLQTGVTSLVSVAVQEGVLVPPFVQEINVLFAPPLFSCPAVGGLTPPQSR